MLEDHGHILDLGKLPVGNFFSKLQSVPLSNWLSAPIGDTRWEG
jgi:hypothetical protein